MAGNATDILLIFPPAFYPYMPYLATASLLGYLRKVDLKCEQKDLNIDFFNYILTQEYLTEAHKKLHDRVLPNFKNDIPKELLLTVHPGMSFIIRNIEIAKKAIQNGVSHFDSLDHRKIIDLGLAVISDSYYPLKLTLSNIRMSYDEQMTTDVWDAIHDEKQNIFIDYFKHVMLSLLHAETLNIVAISVTAPTQIIATFTLCKLIREMNPQIKIVLGGNIVTRLQEFFSKENVLSQFYDYCVVGEGEQKLATLIQHLNSGMAEKLPENSTAKIVNDAVPLDLNIVATPDFDGLPLKSYFNEDTILPIYSSRRCYWDRCTFCDIPHGFDITHRKRNSSIVVDDIEHLHMTYNVNYFKFVDEALHPRTMLEVSNELVRRKLEIYWEAYAILEKDFTDIEFCHDIYNGGCRWLYFGFETGTKSISSKMNKRHSLSKVEDILRTTAAAGIKNHLWIIIGFPGQTREDVAETVRFIEQNNSVIHSIEINQFTLTKHAPIMKNNLYDVFGVKPITKPEKDIALTYDYEIEGDFVNQSEAAAIVREMRKELFIRYGFSNAVRSSNLTRDNKLQNVHYMEVV